MRQTRDRVAWVMMSVLLAAAWPCAPVAWAESKPNPSPAEADGPSVVRVEKTEDGYRLLRNGEPYFIRGTGGHLDMESFAAAGGNSVRTWGADDLEGVLDKAHRLGLTVTIGIWLGHPKHGFDYGDEQQVREQLEKARAYVRRYKDHPALLLWGVGNEVEIQTPGDERVYRAINDIARMIKEEDPNHPTMSVTAGIGSGRVENFVRYCPDVDIYGPNAYGDLDTLAAEMRAAGLTKPYVVPEFGPLGSWAQPRTEWGSALDPNSTEKARTYLRSYKLAIEGEPSQCLGSYVFMWRSDGEKQVSWYSMTLPDGTRFESANAMQYAWTGRWPDNHAPRVVFLRSPATRQVLEPGQPIEAEVSAYDPDNDPLRYEWFVAFDTRVKDRKSSETIRVPQAIVSAEGAKVRARAPREPGAYRLHAFVYDGQGHVATANFAFLVPTEQQKIELASAAERASSDEDASAPIVSRDIPGRYHAIEASWSDEVVLFEDGTIGRPEEGDVFRNEGTWRFEDGRLVLDWQAYDDEPLKPVVGFEAETLKLRKIGNIEDESP